MRSMVTRISTTAQLRDNAERCRRLAREVDDPLTTQRLAALEGVGRLTQNWHDGSCLCLAIKGTPEARRNYRARASDRSTPRRTMASAAASRRFPIPASAGNA